MAGNIPALTLTSSEYNSVDFKSPLSDRITSRFRRLGHLIAIGSDVVPSIQSRLSWSSDMHVGRDQAGTR